MTNHLAPALAMHDVTAGYGSTTVLREVTLSVPASTVVALLGPNGAGKTTVLRVASMLLRPSTGTVHLDGEDMSRRQPEHLARAGLCHVPEGRGVFRRLTVRENLRLARGATPVDEALALAAEVFPILGQRMEQIAGTLSGGQQQMLSLARAYVSKPRVMLLDEVSMGLAPNVADDIFIFLRRAAGEGVALLLVEQYVSRALELADLVYILQKGRIAFAGEPSELDGSDLFAHYVGV